MQLAGQLGASETKRLEVHRECSSARAPGRQWAWRPCGRAQRPRCPEDVGLTQGLPSQVSRLEPVTVHHSSESALYRGLQGPCNSSWKAIAGSCSHIQGPSPQEVPHSQALCLRASNTFCLNVSCPCPYPYLELHCVLEPPSQMLQLKPSVGLTHSHFSEGQGVWTTSPPTA
jgi:hypothetical protein